MEQGNDSNKVWKLKGRIRSSKAVPDPFVQGMITALGVILAFILAFFRQWSTGGGDASIPSLCFFSLGVFFLIFAMMRSLNPKNRRIEQYRFTKNTMLWGLIFFCCGIVSSVYIDLYGLPAFSILTDIKIYFNSFIDWVGGWL